MKRVLMFALLFLLTGVSVSYAETCMTAACHAEYSKMKNLHGPTAAGECVVCHTAKPAEIAQHIARPKSFVDFKSPVKEGQAVCMMCHDDKKEGKYVHNPVEQQECVACHNPHGGNNRYFINSAREADTCFQCHENNKMSKKHLHGPVGVGECASCHNPHASDNKYQLRQPRETICFACHSDKAELMKKDSVHKPLKSGDSCLACHDPHNSDAAFHLNAPTQPDLCFRCHEKQNPALVDMAKNAKYKHRPVADGNCGSCHNPHDSKFGKLLRSDEKVVCFECHKGIGENVSSKTFKHGPVTSDGCGACHEVHGSNNPRILAKHFPDTFYNGYRDGLYELCFDCHSDALLKNKETKDETGFRNGTRNLHTLHIKIPGKGRSCKACHEVHASSQPVQVRESVPYGGSTWQLPVTFTKLQNGGSCVVGCHKPKEYNRISPVQYK